MTLRLTKATTALLLALLTLSACGGTPEQKEARHLKHGNELFAAGQFDKARLEYLNAARIKPTDADAIYHLGLVDDAQGNFRDAFVNFTNAEQQDKHFYPAILKLAEYYLAGDQYAQASQRIDIVLAEKPNDPQARALLAARFLRQKLYDEAESEAHKSLNANPNNIIAFGVLASVYKAQNNPTKAMATIEDGVAHNPKDETLLRLQAELYEQQGDLQKASQAYQTLFQVAPMQKKYRLKLADDYIKAGQMDQAEAVLRAGVSALADDWEMKHLLVEFLDNHRSLEAAEQELQQYIVANPERSEPVDWLADLYITHNKIDQANTFLNQIISQKNYDQLWIHAMTSRAKIYYLKQDLDMAGKLANDVLAKAPNDLDAAFIKAHVEASQGSYEQAAIDLRGIIRDRPKAKEAYELLSEILLHQGHKDLAIETLNQLADITPLNPAQQVRLAQIYALNGDTKKGMDMLLITTKMDPNYSVGWEMTARLALGLKDWATADAAIDTLDGLQGQHMTALLLRGEKMALTGNLPDAIKAYTTIINSDSTAPQAEHALPVLVQYYQIQGQLREAIRYLETINPKTSLVSTLLGQCYLAAGNNDKAQTAFDKAVADHARQQDPYLGLAKLFIDQHKLDAALGVLEQAATVNIDDMRAPLAEAQLLEKTGNYQAAIKLYTNLLGKHTESDLIANNLAELIADNASTDHTLMEQARQIAERFTASPNPLLLDTLGWVYFRLGRTQDALALFGRASALAPNLPPQFHYHYGIALLSDHQRDQALAELRQAVVKDANYQGHDEAEKLLASLSTPN